MDLSTGVIINSEGGIFLSEDHRRVAEIIHDYDPSLHVKYVPEEDTPEFPYAIIHTPNDGRSQYVVRRVRLQDMNETIVAWLWDNDQRHNNIHDHLANMDKAREAVALRKQIDVEERKREAQEFAKSALTKNYFRHNGRLLD
jgi:hypothetical protein